MGRHFLVLLLFAILMKMAPSAVMAMPSSSFSNESNPIWAAGSPKYAFLRSVLTLDQGKAVTSATAYITAQTFGPSEKLLGSYRLYLAGRCVGVGPGRGDGAVGHFVAPVDAIDVTTAVRNAFGSADFGGGIVVAVQAYAASGPEGRVQMELIVFHDDGSVLRFGTGSTKWVGFDADEFFRPTASTGGAYSAPQENLDATMYPAGWRDSVTFASRAFFPVEDRPPFTSLTLKETLPLSIEEGLSPHSVVHKAPGHIFVDMGEELMGGLSLSVSNLTQSTDFEVTLGEELTANGTVLYPMRTGNHYRSTFRAAPNLTAGLEQHEYAEFRYVDIHFNATVGMAVHVAAWRVRYPFNDSQSAFHSANAMLNRVWKLCKDTLRITSLDTCTDSNTRERLPYEADGYITAMSRFALQREFAWPRHSFRYNINNPTWPTEWRQYTPLMALSDYMQTANATLYREFADLLSDNSQAFCLDVNTDLVNYSSCARQAGTRDIVDWPSASRDGYVLTDVNTVVNSLLVKSLTALSFLANATGRTARATALAQQASATAAAVNLVLFDEATGLYVDGLGLDGSNRSAEQHSSWHAQVYALFAGVVPAERHASVLQFLKRKRMAGSVYGSFAFLLGLYEALDTDHGDLALEMMTNCETKSWCHMLKVGATATMEAWSTQEKPNLSWSHAWATAPITAIVSGFMGLKPLAPGWSRFQFKPQPGNVTWASILVPTIAGSLQCAIRQDIGRFEASLHILGAMEGTVCLPTLSRTSPYLLVDGRRTSAQAHGDYLCVAGFLGPRRHVVSRVIETDVFV